MPLYLAPYIGTGTRRDPFRPSGSDQVGWSAIDLRPDSRSIDGRALLVLPVHDPRLNQFLVASARAEKFGAASRTRMRALVGVEDAEADDVPTLARAILFRASRRAGLCRPVSFNRFGIREVWLGRERIAIEQGGPLDLSSEDPTDNFNRANADPIGGNWTTVPGAGSMRLVSNAIAASADADSCAYWNAATAPNDQWSEVVVTDVQDGDAGPACRVSTSAFTYYFGSLFASGSIALCKFVAGAFSSIDAGSFSPTNGDVFRVEAEGSTIRLKQNSVVVGGPTTDTDIASGRWGVAAFNSAVRMDDWQGGDFSTGISIAPPQGNVALSSTAPLRVVGSRPASAAGQLALSAVAPIVARTDHRNISPAGANAVLSPTAPVVAWTDNRNISPAAANAVLSPTAPIVARTDHRNISPAGANLVLSPTAPSLVVGTNALPAAGQLALSSVAPTVARTDHRNISPAGANLALSGTAPSLLAGFNMSPQTQQLMLNKRPLRDENNAPILDGNNEPIFSTIDTAPTVLATAHVFVSPAAAQLALSSVAPTRQINLPRNPAGANLTISTAAPAMVINFRRDPAVGQLLLTPTIPSVQSGNSFSIVPATKDFVLSAVAPTITWTDHRAISPAAGNVVLSAVAPTVVRTDHRNISPSAANLVLSSAAPSLFSGNAHAMSPATRDMVLSSVAPVISRTSDIFVTPAAASLSLSTFAPTVVKSGRRIVTSSRTSDVNRPSDRRPRQLA